MFRLLLRQYDGVGEVIRALAKTYVINSRTAKDVQAMWVGLSRVRELLPVQMSQEEEELMRELLWKMVNNHVFFQHPDLIRILRTHENVMAIMMNTLGTNTLRPHPKKRQFQPITTPKPKLMFCLIVQFFQLKEPNSKTNVLLY